MLQFGNNQGGFGASSNNLEKLLKQAGVGLALLSNKADGKKKGFLEVRTLPNGTENKGFTQRVSNDFVLKSADVLAVMNRATFSQAQVNFTSFIPAAVPPIAPIQGTFSIEGWTEKADNILIPYEEFKFSTGTPDGGRMMFDIPLGTTLVEARAMLAGVVMRYELAAPIDTLNVPFTNPWIDMANVEGKNLVDSNTEYVNLSGGTAAKWNGSYLEVTAPINGYGAYNPNKIKVLPNTNYVLSVKTAVVSGTPLFPLGGARIHLVNTNTYTAPTNSPNHMFNTGSNTEIEVMFYVGLPASNVCAQRWFDIQLELGSLPTTYEPYAKNNALLANFAGTDLSGYTEQLVLNDQGMTISYDNLVSNGDLIKGLAGWTPHSNATLSLESGKLVVLAGAVNPTASVYQALGSSVALGDRIYCSMMASVDGLSQAIQIQAYGPGFSPYLGVITRSNPTANLEAQLSGIITTTTASADLLFYARHNYTTAELAAGRKMKISAMKSINLTTNPTVQLVETRLGRILTVDECDRIFAYMQSNIVENGDFATQNGWGNGPIPKVIVNNECVCKATTQWQSLASVYRPSVVGERVYGRALVRANTALVRLSMYDGITYTTEMHSGSGEFELMSVIKTNAAVYASQSVFVQDQRPSGWDEFTVREVMWILLDSNPYVQRFEALAKRPITVAECDAMFSFILESGGDVNVLIESMLKPDGIDDLAMLGGTDSVDIKGTDEFEITVVFMTPATPANSQLICKALDGMSNTTQYGVGTLGDGSLFLTCANASIYMVPIGTLKPNSLYMSTCRRKAGKLTHELNQLETYNQFHTAPIVSYPNFRLFARPNNAAGTIHNLIASHFFAGFMVTRNPKDWNKLAKATKMAFKNFALPTKPAARVKKIGDFNE